MPNKSKKTVKKDLAKKVTKGKTVKKVPKKKTAAEKALKTKRANAREIQRAQTVEKVASKVKKRFEAKKKTKNRLGRLTKLKKIPHKIAASIKVKKIRNKDVILVLDFGSQYTQLIARRIRENKVYSQIVPFNISAKEILEIKPKGIVLSGGPLSVYDEGAPKPDQGIFDLDIPILGICYGMQLINQHFGGAVKASTDREFGRAELFVDNPKYLFANLPTNITCWMSHGDEVKKLPAGFQKIAHTLNASIAAFANTKKRIYGVQFHPEVVHTQRGDEILSNFLFGISGCLPRWSVAKFVDQSIKQISEKVGSKKVILGLSGGVDSSVAAVLLSKAIGRRLYCIFVDNGLLRKNEVATVQKTFKNNFKINLTVINAEKRFLDRLKGIIDPEEKRKVIGDEFVSVFCEKAKKIKGVQFLAQGTLYPDVIESVSPIGGPSAVIKSHHNVGGLSSKLDLDLIEPFRELFKDEVRVIGKTLAVPETIIKRQPFPGPGLAIRIIGEVTKERLDMLREADERVLEEIKKAGLYNEIWQSFAVLLPVQSVGVMGDKRTYEYTIAIRCVTSVDGMTADWAEIPKDILGKISNRIINEVQGINRVVYDISSKPPATIEWE